MSAELRPTPETDAAIQSMPGRLPDFARKLERERDEAREKITMLQQRLIERTADMLAKLVEVERTARLWEKRYNEQTATLALTAQERDEARAALESHKQY